MSAALVPQERSVGSPRLDGRERGIRCVRRRQPSAGEAFTFVEETVSTPEIDPVTAESMQEDADFGEEHTEPTFRDQVPEPSGTTTEDEGRSDHGGMDPR